MNDLNALRNRRSIRKFSKEPVEQETVNQIIQAGTWAPSGLNNQPWKFLVVGEDRDLVEKLARCTKYGSIIRGAPVCIAVFLDTETSYHREKDIQAIGESCICAWIKRAGFVRPRRRKITSRILHKCLTFWLR